MPWLLKDLLRGHMKKMLFVRNQFGDIEGYKKHEGLYV